ncbi:hypothetical protein, partial [Paracoccus sp. M683]|uniref:hypothetical protein n=1 Tax=Paracoccus sp. M683 TaxID=2594268 RepID=UPI00163DC237
GVATATNIFAPCWIITTTRATSPRAIVCEDETMIYELRDQPAGLAESRPSLRTTRMTKMRRSGRLSGKIK